MEHNTAQQNAVVAVFKRHEDAEDAVRKLAGGGFDMTHFSIVGQGYHSEEKVVGFYNIGDRIKFWGKNGAFWGGIWSLFFGGIFLTIPMVGPVMVLGHLAGMVVAAGMLDLAPAAYLDRTLVAMDWSHLALGFIKSFVFGALIGLVSCYSGLYAERNAEGVGVATTNAVVVSIVGIIVLDAVFAVCANALGW